ncbi:MAG: nucleoside deaminase [Sphingomicrobium sp.]|nr:nucleoside deaminase [Sphingomonadales bacterium]
MTHATASVKAVEVTGFPLPPPMRRALDLAAEAAASGEVPVGAVVTHGEDVVGEARNAMRGTLDPTAHAEMVALRHAATRLGQARLDGCTLWVTLEPCAMCAAAIGLARIDKLVFGAEDPKGGAVVNGPRLYSLPTCHHRPQLLGGIGEIEAASQLRQFFALRRR